MMKHLYYKKKKIKHIFISLSYYAFDKGMKYLLNQVGNICEETLK